MKFATIFSLALSALQVQATPVAAGAVSPRLAPGRNGYCCVLYKNPQNTIYRYVPREDGGIVIATMIGSCQISINRGAPGTSCDKWTFTPTSSCDYMEKPITGSSQKADQC
ncbi:hypothetical protein E4U55_004988 [Claviceps digitariae]|nr:hypothetical protein E4U55_004988 [Claviceps digitariae]